MDSSTESEKLRKRVSPTAKWRPCVVCGPVERPTFSKKRMRDGSLYVAAKCPQCACFLGYVPQASKARKLEAVS